VDSSNCIRVWACLGRVWARLGCRLGRGGAKLAGFGRRGTTKPAGCRRSWARLDLSWTAGLDRKWAADEGRNAMQLGLNLTSGEKVKSRRMQTARKPHNRTQSHAKHRHPRRQPGRPAPQAPPCVGTPARRGGVGPAHLRAMAIFTPRPTTSRVPRRLL
jgi:hypothetical protein